jgi:hypothetical protein
VKYSANKCSYQSILISRLTMQQTNKLNTTHYKTNLSFTKQQTNQAKQTTSICTLYKRQRPNPSIETHYTFLRTEAGEAAAQLGCRWRRRRRLDRRDVGLVHAAIVAPLALLPEPRERSLAVVGGLGDGHPLDELVGLVGLRGVVAVQGGAQLHQLRLELRDPPVLLRLRRPQPHRFRQLFCNPISYQSNTVTTDRSIVN